MGELAHRRDRKPSPRQPKQLPKQQPKHRQIKQPAQRVLRLRQLYGSGWRPWAIVASGSGTALVFNTMIAPVSAVGTLYHYVIGFLAAALGVAVSTSLLTEPAFRARLETIREAAAYLHAMELAFGQAVTPQGTRPVIIVVVEDEGTT